MSQQKYCYETFQWNTAFKSVAWIRSWSWTLAISSLFCSDLDKFKLETQIKVLKNVVDENRVRIKEAIKIISSLNGYACYANPTDTNH